MRLFLATATVLALSGAASAGPCNTLITQTRSYGPNTPNYTQAMTFDQYTGFLADVCSIKVTLELEISGGFLGVDNDGIDPATVTVQLGATTSISSNDVVLLNNAFQPVTGTASAFTGNTFNLAGDNGDGPNNVDLSPPDGATHLGGNDSDMRMGFINPLFWGGFVGFGTYDIIATAQQILDFGSVGGVEGAFSPVTSSGTVTVEMLVPEPTTMALLALGAAAALRRRRA
jgi:hypothetical protein